MSNLDVLKERIISRTRLKLPIKGKKNVNINHANVTHVGNEKFCTKLFLFFGVFFL